MRLWEAPATRTVICRPGRRGLARLGLLLMLVAPGVSGHEQKTAVTRILLNERTGNIEVMHRFLVHDAEHAMGSMTERSVDLLKDEQDRARFAAYVRERFMMANSEGNALPLSPVGNEIDGNHIWIYSETPIPQSLPGLLLTHDALRDVWSDQVNLVNIEFDGGIRSATFSGGEREHLITLTGD